MPDMSTHITVDSGVSSVVYDNVRQLFYYAADTAVYSWDPVSGESEALFFTDSAIGSIALSDDGSRMIVGLSQAIYSSDTNSWTGTVLSVPMASSADTSKFTTWTYQGAFYEMGVADMAVTPDNQIVMTTNYGGSGWTPLRTFAVSTPAGVLPSTTVNGQSEVTGGSFLIESEHGRYILFQEVNISNAPLELYDTQTRSIVARTDFYKPPFNGGYNHGNGDVSEAAGLVVDVIYGVVVAFDLNLNLVKVLSSSTFGNSQFSDGKFLDDGKQLMLWRSESGDAIILDTTTWLQIGMVDLSESAGYRLYGGDHMVISDDGRFLFLQDGIDYSSQTSDIWLIDLNARMHITHTGAEGNDTLEDKLGGGILIGLGGNDILSGGEGDDLLNGGNGNDSLNGGVGDDTATYADAEGGVTVDLRLAGAQATGQGLDTLTSVENIIGSAFADTLVGNSGNNRLDGATGADVMSGGDGNDTYVIDAPGDGVMEQAGGGIDRVEASISWILSENVEALTLVGSNNIDGTGNAGDNTIRGNGGNNRLDGGEGADILIGGEGNDTYVLGIGDAILEDVSGSDTVIVSIDYTLADSLEGLILTGTAINGTGNNNSNALFGNASDNVLYGLDGSDYLDGGESADTMIGGSGSDTYTVDNLGDIVVEEVGYGVDVVYSSVSFSLSANIETLVLLGSANLSAFGSAGYNTIVGNIGNNWIDGGSETDKLIGGAGDDTYIADTFELIEEYQGQGTDTIFAFTSFSMPSFVEVLLLQGEANLSARGNNEDNQLIGNSGANRLDGWAGADRMTGRAGNDIYVVDNVGDRVIESNNQGIDTVETGMSYALTGLYVENLTVSGTGNFAVGGNGFANVLIGNSGNNTINGGLNGDTMSGGAGNDLYFVDHIGDVVIELANEGKDAVNASITYTLTDNVETLALIGYQAINGTGNALDNTVTGNGNANQLNGGDGKDLLIGQGGNDTLTGGAGADSFRFYRAGALNGLDHLTDFVSGTDKLQLTGADYGFAKGQVLTAAQVHTGGSVGAFGQFLYNIVNHTLYWDADGTGAAAAVALAVFDNAATPLAGDFVFL